MEHSTTPGPECDVLWCPNQATHFDTQAIEFRCDEHKAVQAARRRRGNGRRVLRKRQPASHIVGRRGDAVT
jgi:hypothetical protein